MTGSWTDWAVNLTACLCLGILFEVVRIRVMVDDIVRFHLKGGEA